MPRELEAERQGRRFDRRRHLRIRALFGAQAQRIPLASAGEGDFPFAVRLFELPVERHCGRLGGHRELQVDEADVAAIRLVEHRSPESPERRVSGQTAGLRIG